MSYNNIEEDNFFSQPEDEYFLQSSEIESSSNTSIDGWRCVVKKANGEPCNYFFSYNTNKGSTSNTISHLRKEHGIIREEVIKKILDKNEGSIQLIIPPLNDYQNTEIKKKLIEFIIKDVQPFHILKSSSFKEFVHSLNPHFNIPCITTIKESLEVMYDHSTNGLNKLINNCQFVSITTDFWTATNQRKGYMGITGTWLTENFEPIEVLLNLVHVPYPHTAITTDNGSNMVSALKLLKNSLEIDRIPCSAHTFQLCIKKALNYNDEIKALDLRAKRLINFFSSPKQLEALEKQQERMKEDYPKVLKPTFDVITRWNSTFKAWIRLLDDQEWELIEKTLESLQENQEPLALHSIEENDQGEVQIFEERNGEKRKKKIKISRPANTKDLYEKIILTLYNSIKHYWLEPSILAMLASALDPRFKHLKFIDNQSHLETLNFLKMHSFNPSSVLFPSGNNSGIFDDLFNDLLQYEEEEVQGEYDKYFSLPTANRQTDPFIWWNSKKNEFPIMSNLAKKYLCINATSVPSVRLFSDVAPSLNQGEKRHILVRHDESVFWDSRLMRHWEKGTGLSLHVGDFLTED
nr:4322_t:CDS:2 [Entrophospora candida]